MNSEEYSKTPLIPIANYQDRLNPSGKFVENSTQLAMKIPVIGSNKVQCYDF
jgi:hypothetical protein